MNLQELHDSVWPLEKPIVDKDNHNWFGAKSVMNHLLTDKIRYYCELGSWTGISLLYACNKMPKETILFAVDIWPSEKNKSTPTCIPAQQKILDKLPTLYETFLVNCWDHKEKIIPLKMLTIEGLEKIHNLNVSLDIIYIDASHQYEDVKNDILISLRLFPDAVLYGDDFFSGQVRKAVLEISELKSFEVFVHANRIWLYNHNLEKIGLTEPPQIMKKIV